MWTRCTSRSRRSKSPALADDPRVVIVSVDPREYPRAVVTTANGVARALGINSGMSYGAGSSHGARARDRRRLRATAARPVRQYSRRLMDLLRTETALLEQRSIDEAALDWRHHGFLSEPVLHLRERDPPRDRSVGVVWRRGEPAGGQDGFRGRQNARRPRVRRRARRRRRRFLAPLSVRALVGVGPKSEARLRGFEVCTIGDLAARPLDWLVDQFGSSYGRYLYAAVARRGRLDAGRRARLQEHLGGAHLRTRHGRRAEIWRRLQGAGGGRGRRLRGENLLAGEVAIKLRYGVTWETITRQLAWASPLTTPTCWPPAPRRLMRKAWTRRPIRPDRPARRRAEAPARVRSGGPAGLSW